MRKVLVALGGALLAALPIAAQPGASLYKIDLESVRTFRQITGGNTAIMVEVVFNLTRQGEETPADVGKEYKILIEEDGREVKRMDVPRARASDDLGLVLAVDISGSMAEGRRMEQTRGATSVFFQQLPAGADAGLILFNHEMRVKEPLGRDRRRLIEHILKAQPGGGTAYLDAVVAGVGMLASGKQRQKAVVVMTDGVDLNSTATLGQAVRDAKARGVKVYTVGIGEPGRQEKMTSVLVLDKSGSMLEPADDQDRVAKIDALKKVATLFTSFVRETDPPIARTTILEFSDTPSPPGPFTNDRAALRRTVAGLSAKGETSLFDATYEAIMALEAEHPPGKRAVVALTDGVDNSSRRRVEEVIAEAKKVKVPLYMLGFGRSGELDEKVMQRMAGETGGRYYHARNQKSLLDIFESLSNQLHDDGIDEAALRELSVKTGGKYYPAKDVSQLQFVLEKVVHSIQHEVRTVSFPSLVQVDDGRKRNVTLKLIRVSTGDVAAAGTASSGTTEVITEQKGQYTLHGLVIPEANHFVYLALLGVIGALLVLPAGLRRWSRPEG